MKDNTKMKVRDEDERTRKKMKGQDKDEEARRR